MVHHPLDVSDLAAESQDQLFILLGTGYEEGKTNPHPGVAWSQGFAQTACALNTTI